MKDTFKIHLKVQFKRCLQTKYRGLLTSLLPLWSFATSVFTTLLISYICEGDSLILEDISCLWGASCVSTSFFLLPSWREPGEG